MALLAILSMLAHGCWPPWTFTWLVVQVRAAAMSVWVNLFADTVGASIDTVATADPMVALIKWA